MPIVHARDLTEAYTVVRVYMFGPTENCLAIRTSVRTQDDSDQWIETPTIPPTCDGW
ncbi:MAG: hypothetical protein AAF809_08225 [Bacteroidota bacterium]